MFGNLDKNPCEDTPRITVLTVNHKSSSLVQREEALITNLQLEQLEAHCSEYLVVETCNRVEVVLVSAGDVPEFWADRSFTRKDENEAVEHLFRVASGLESAILGESQILGQLKQAWQDAHDKGTTGPILNRLFHSAFRFAKRVRTTTGLGRHSLSSAVAVSKLAHQVFGTLSKQSVFFVGTGEMALLTMKHLSASGCERFYISSRSAERAKEISEKFNTFSVPTESINSYLAEVDIFVSARSDFNLSASELEPYVGASPKIFIDLAVPRSLDPAIGELDGSFLFNIDHLQDIVTENLAKREREVDKVEEMLPEAVEHFFRWKTSRPLEELIKQSQEMLDEDGLLEEKKIVNRLRAAGVEGETLFVVKKALADYRRNFGARLLHRAVTSLKDEEGARSWFVKWFCRE